MNQINFDVDDGVNFGLWDDPLSKFIYQDCMQSFLMDFPLHGLGDLGGGLNKWDKKFATKTIDIDPKKQPDIVDNILTHQGDYKSLLCRYVLHYLSDKEIGILFENIANYFLGKMLVIQFHQDGVDLQIKKDISNKSGEGIKYFRTFECLKNLIPNIQTIKSFDYIVSPSFYKNRLNIDTDISHKETVTAFYLEF